MNIRRLVFAFGFAAAVAQAAPAQAFTFSQFGNAAKGQEARVVTQIERRAEIVPQTLQQQEVPVNGADNQPNPGQAKKLRAISSALMFR